MNTMILTSGVILCSLGLRLMGGTSPSQYTVVLPRGYSLIGNQLNRGSNTVGEVLPRAPEGTVLYKFDAATQNYTVNQYLRDRWLDPTQTLAPGEGAWIYNPSNQFSLVVSGTEPQTATFPVLYKGLNLVSLPSFDHLLPTPQQGDVIYQFLAGSHWQKPNEYHQGLGWERPPAFAAGEAFFYSTSAGLEPKSVPTFGTVYAASYVPAFAVDAPVIYDDWITPLSGPMWWAQLYGGPSESALKPAGIPIPLASDSWAGYFFGGVVEIPDVQPGMAATVQVRVWPGCLFASFEDALVGPWDYWTMCGYPPRSTTFQIRHTGSPRLGDLPPGLRGDGGPDDRLQFGRVLTPYSWFFSRFAGLDPSAGIVRTAGLGSDVDWGIRPDASLSEYRWQKRDPQGQWQEAPQFVGSIFPTVTFEDAGSYHVVAGVKNLCDFQLWSPILTLVVVGPPRWLNLSFDAAQRRFRADLVDLSNGGYRIEKSTDLVNWSLVVTVTNSPAGFQMVDTNAVQSHSLFYRARLIP